MDGRRAPRRRGAAHPRCRRRPPSRAIAPSSSRPGRPPPLPRTSRARSPWCLLPPACEVALGVPSCSSATLPLTQRYFVLEYPAGCLLYTKLIPGKVPLERGTHFTTVRIFLLVSPPSSSGRGPPSSCSKRLEKLARGSNDGTRRARRHAARDFGLAWHAHRHHGTTWPLIREGDS